MTPQKLLAERQRDYKKARDRHARAISRQREAMERVQALERELADAEDEDRRALGEALVDGARPPARKADQARAALDKAKAESEALAYAAQRAGQALDQSLSAANATGYGRPNATSRPPAPTMNSGSTSSPRPANGSPRKPR